MKTSVIQCNPCYSAVSALLMNPLPDRSNYLPFCHTHYFTLDQYFTSLFGPDPLYQAAPLETNTSLQQLFTAEFTQEKRSALRKLNNQQRQVSMFLILLFKLLTQLPLSLFSLSLSSLCSLSQSSLYFLSTIPSFSSVSS